MAFRFGKIPKIINARCGRQRFLRFKGTWGGVGHPEMPPSCLELNSDDFPFFKIPPRLLARLEPEIAFSGVVIRNRHNHHRL